MNIRYTIAASLLALAIGAGSAMAQDTCHVVPNSTKAGPMCNKFTCLESGVQYAIDPGSFNAQGRWDNVLYRAGAGLPVTVYSASESGYASTLDRINCNGTPVSIFTPFDNAFMVQ